MQLFVTQLRFGAEQSCNIRFPQARLAVGVQPATNTPRKRLPWPLSLPATASTTLPAILILIPLINHNFILKALIILSSFLLLRKQLPLASLSDRANSLPHFNLFLWI